MTECQYIKVKPIYVQRQKIYHQFVEAYEIHVGRNMYIYYPEISKMSKTTTFNDRNMLYNY
jgi:hypothetical protein